MKNVMMTLMPASLGKRSAKVRRIPFNSNKPLHWAEKLHWKKAWLDCLWWAFLPVRKEFGKLPLAICKIEFVLYATHLQDTDNSYQSIKPLLDGLKIKGGLGIIVDDRPDLVNLFVRQLKVEHKIDEHVEVNFEF